MIKGALALSMKSTAYNIVQEKTWKMIENEINWALTAEKEYDVETAANKVAPRKQMTCLLKSALDMGISLLAISSPLLK